jgi:hypothetical protein
MTKPKIFVVTALAAATIGVGGLVAPPSASAQPKYSCSQALTISLHYMAIGDVFYGLGSYANASYYYGKASGILEASC